MRLTGFTVLARPPSIAHTLGLIGRMNKVTKAVLAVAAQSAHVTIFSGPTFAATLECAPHGVVLCF